METGRVMDALLSATFLLAAIVWGTFGWFRAWQRRCLLERAESVLISAQEDIRVLELPEVHEALAPLLYTLPLRPLSYHVAVLKGTDVDQPRNLAKSVTVE